MKVLLLSLAMLATAQAFYSEDNTGSSETGIGGNSAIQALSSNVNNAFADQDGGGEENGDYDDEGGEADAEGGNYQNNDGGNPKTRSSIGGQDAGQHNHAHAHGHHSGSPITINIEGLSAGKINGQDWGKKEHHSGGDWWKYYHGSTSKSECSGGFTSLGWSCVMVAPIQATRAEAARYCHAFHGFLAAPHNPYENYRLKYHILANNLSSRTFWTSGRKVEGNWIWENTRKQIDYNHWQTPTRLDDDEMEQWEFWKKKNNKDSGSSNEESSDDSKDKKKDVDNNKFMEPLTENCRCITIGPGSDGEVIWKDEKCLETKAHFICQKKTRVPSSSHHSMKKSWKNWNWGHGKTGTGGGDGDDAGMVSMLSKLMENAMIKKAMEHKYITRFKQLGKTKYDAFMKDHAPKMVDKAYSLAETYMNMALQGVNSLINGDMGGNGGNSNGGNSNNGGGQYGGNSNNGYNG